MAKDFLGNKISEGDKIVVGADNGSTLSICSVTKVTGKYVFFNEKVLCDGTEYIYKGRRWHDRVVVLK